MTPDTLFSIANPMALAGWLTLIAGIVLKRPLLRDRIAGLYVPLFLATAYTVLILIFWWGAEGGFDSLANVQKLFTSPWIALGGWVHYLAYDLAIGAILSRQIMERGLSRLFLIPILPLAFLFGPIGYLVAQTLLLTRSGNVS
jgi:Domain of unknown function (DUF4281)